MVKTILWFALVVVGLVGCTSQGQLMGQMASVNPSVGHKVLTSVGCENRWSRCPAFTLYGRPWDDPTGPVYYIIDYSHNACEVDGATFASALVARDKYFDCKTNWRFPR